MKNIFSLVLMSIVLVSCWPQKPSTVEIKDDTPPAIETTKTETPHTTPEAIPEKTTNTGTKPQIDKKETPAPKTDTKDIMTTDEMTKELDTLIDEIVSGK